MAFDTKHLSITIDRDWRDVYEFLAAPEHMAQWASGLGSGLEPAGEEWTAQGPEGPVQIRFTPRNAFGIVDHVVTVQPGVEVFVPMRVMANGTGAEVVFTLFRQPTMTPELFERDAEWVMKDLRTLKAVLEG